MIAHKQGNNRALDKCLSKPFHSESYNLTVLCSVESCDYDGAEGENCWH